jgi:hypothetical protein
MQPQEVNSASKHGEEIDSSFKKNSFQRKQISGKKDRLNVTIGTTKTRLGTHFNPIDFMKHFRYTNYYLTHENLRISIACFQKIQRMQ